MKWLLLVTLVISGTAYAGDNPTCDELSKRETTRLAALANNYFWNEIAKKVSKDPKLTMVYGSFKGAEYTDCHDYDSEFDHMEFTLSWKQKNEDGAVQKCELVVDVSYQDEVSPADEEIKCEDI